MRTDKVLHGEAVTLRCISVDDVSAEYVAWMNDREVIQYLESRFYPQDKQSVSAFVESMLKSDADYFFAILDKETGKHIGNIKLGSINPHHLYADIGIILGDKDFWGKGRARDAIRLVTRFAFEELNLRKVTAGAYSINQGSVKAFLANGFSIEGEWKSHYLTDEKKTVDGICLGILNEKFKSS